jgi:hypothetical protein
MSSRNPVRFLWQAAWWAREETELVFRYEEGLSYQAWYQRRGGTILLGSHYHLAWADMITDWEVFSISSSHHS